MRKISLLLLVAVTLGACKKDSENTPTTSKTDLLAAKSWRISTQTSSFSSSNINNGTPVTTDEYAASSACERDNFIKFNTNKTLVVDEGASRCDTSDPQTQNGTWDFNSDQTKLTMIDPSQGSVPIQFDIVELSASKLQLRYSYSYSSGGISATQTENVTFSAF
jgi:hypothetical protein